MNHNLEELFVMAMPIFVDLQGSIVEKRFVIKEVLRKETVLFHIIFLLALWNLLTKSKKTLALPDWMIIMDCNGKTGWSTWQNAWLQRSY